MSEKRFTEIYGSKKEIISVIDNMSNKKMVCTLDLIQKMNELAEENKKCKTEMENYKHQCKKLLESHSDYDEDLGICCICENLKGTYIEQYHEAEYHCKIDGFKVERQKRLCKKFQISKKIQTFI